MVNSLWEDLFRDVSMTSLDFWGSDHRALPILLAPWRAGRGLRVEVSILSHGGQRISSANRRFIMLGKSLPKSALPKVSTWALRYGRIPFDSGATPGIVPSHVILEVLPPILNGGKNNLGRSFLSGGEEIGSVSSIRRVL